MLQALRRWWSPVTFDDWLSTHRMAQFGLHASLPTNPWRPGIILP